ncbi:MAG: hypothetical protein WCT85_04915 [Parachlamydiales bacterium]|jgi:hypothetical protein
MNRYLFLFLSVLLIHTTFAEEDQFEGKQEDTDMDALRKWIREKRLVTVKELGGDLSISGETRVEFQNFNEIKNGIKQRGEGSATDKANHAFDVEVNLMMDYHSERGWSSIKIEFDNDMGVISGTTYKLQLERAYLGGRMIDGETFNLDGELGRRYLGNVFESKIQYSALFDGGLLKFNKAFESIGNFYFNIGAFVVNDFFDHFGEVAELGMLKIADTGVFVKYSVINWKRHYSDPVTNRRFNFLNSQLLLGYQSSDVNWYRYYKFYIAGETNHLAKRLVLAKTVIDPFHPEDKFIKYNQRYNLAWYVGVSLGRILKANDWAIDLSYQYVMPQAVPDYDSGGIKRGNAENFGLYTENIKGTGDPTTIENAVGNENYKGFNLEVLYAITNNLTLFQSFQISKNQTKKVGPRMEYKMYEMEFIYAF